MSDYLSLKEIIKGPKKGDLVYVRHSTEPEIRGIYQIKKRVISSNFPYRIEHNRKPYLIKKSEVLPSLGKISWNV